MSGFICDPNAIVHISFPGYARMYRQWEVRFQWQEQYRAERMRRHPADCACRGHQQARRPRGEVVVIKWGWGTGEWM